MKQELKNYLSVSKKEWNGLVVLVLLIILILAAPYFYQIFNKDNTINANDFNAAVAQLNHAKSESPTDAEANNKRNITPLMFKFNPNHLPAEKWKALGLSDKQILVIQHYEAKGGKFFYKEDVQKMYTLTADDYKRMEPYILLASKGAGAGAIIELNSADSVALTRLPGVWPSVAVRIIHYRERLGGFYKKEQLAEVFGLDGDKYDAIKNQVVVNAKRIKKIRVNKVHFSGLSHFPYLSFKQMNAIITYRDQHGDYESIADLSNIVILDQNVLHKIAPYLSFK